MIFFSRAWWPEILWRQIWLQPIFNPLLLWHLTFKTSQVFATPITPSSAVAGFLLWMNVSSPGLDKVSSVHNCPSIQVPPVFSLLAPEFRLLLTLFLSLDFSLSLVWPLWSAGGRRKKRDWTGWRSKGKREEIETKDASKAKYMLSPQHICVVPIGVLGSV